MKKLIKTLSLLLVMIFMLSVISPVFKVDAAAVKLNKTSATVYIGKTVTLKVKGTKKKVKWYSKDKSIAAVSDSGKVKGKKEGSTTITAKVDGKTLKCKINVKKDTRTKIKTKYYSVRVPNEWGNNYVYKIAKYNGRQAIDFYEKNDYYGVYGGWLCSLILVTEKENIDNFPIRCENHTVKKLTTKDTNKKYYLIMIGSTDMQFSEENKELYNNMEKHIMQLYKSVTAINSTIKNVDYTKEAPYNIIGAYKKILKKNRPKESTYNDPVFCLYDIDGNNVPELFLKLGYCEADYYYKVYTFKNGKACSLGKLGAGHSGLYTSKKKNGVYRVMAHSGYEVIDLITLKDGKLKTKTTYEGMLNYNEDYKTPGKYIKMYSVFLDYMVDSWFFK